MCFSVFYCQISGITLLYCYISGTVQIPNVNLKNQYFLLVRKLNTLPLILLLPRLMCATFCFVLCGFCFSGGTADSGPGGITDLGDSGPGWGITDLGDSGPGGITDLGDSGPGGQRTWWGGGRLAVQVHNTLDDLVHQKECVVLWCI